MLENGLRGFMETLRDFWEVSRPKLFAIVNGREFANYLLNNPKIQNEKTMLVDIVGYKYNSLLTLVDDTAREISISFIPDELVSFLSNGLLPDESLTRGDFFWLR